MAKDLEKLIDDVEIPEMEYTKPKRKSVSYEVPEIVLPKTKAEMYEEAKGRLTQKTTAASKAFNEGAKPRRSRHDKSPKKVKTVELDSAAAAVAGTASNETRSAERKSVEELKARLNNLKKIVEEPKWVGSADELIPFAWRNPLVDVARPTKYYRSVVRTDKNRKLLLPVPREK